MKNWPKTMFRFSTLFYLIFLLIIPPSRIHAQDSLDPKQKTLLDSLLNNFSIEELARFKEYYQNEIRLLEREKRLQREKGINDGEKIYAINPNGKFMDKVLFRLAEYYYHREQDELFKRMDEYDKQYVRYEEGKLSEPPEEPKPDYSKVIEKYELIVKNFPQSKLMDDVLYHLAYTYDKNFEEEKAFQYYKQVAENYPDSPNAPEALIRLGEYYFDLSRRDLGKAIAYYSQVLHYRDTPRYNEALYKLGWSYYLQGQYESSIETLTLLVQDIEKNAPRDPFGEYTNPSLKEEALEYIGICFHDYGGLPRAVAFVDSLGRPEYGVPILVKLGDIYRENEEKYTPAMLTYRALLERYPYDISAPDVQEKIVLCARKLEDDQEIYLAQQKLFETYKPDSEWSQKISEKIDDPEERQKVLDKAYRKSEFALRDNINLSIKQGEAGKDSSYYRLAVQDAQKYLQAFPYDSSAYTIHWNAAVLLDTKLGKKEEAYQAYLDVCNNYIQDKFKKFAAQNAIVVARELAPEAETPDSVQAELAVNEMDSTQVAQPKTISESDKRLIEAYNNFIMHFPHEEQTAVVLGNVGNIYYGNDDFNNALRYFNTLLRRFPDSPTSKSAQLTAMESYFGKRDYASTEVVAKRIKNREDLPEEFRVKAERRLAESIYLHAESLAGENDHLKAANEFKRVIEEVPDAVFADKALFQAGVQYDQAKEFSRAIEMYSQLTNRFPDSQHYLDAVNNLALDYGELKEYLLAARTYENLSAKQPDSTKAQDALYNSSYFFVQAKDWRDAIRINRMYVDHYPDADDSEDMFYNMAEYYLKLDDYDHANGIYGEFAAKYPESPRTVETFFKRGSYFKGKGRIQDALREFDLAVAKHKELKAKNLPANEFYAAEALFAKSEEQYAEYMKIKFSRGNIDMAQNRKKELLKQLVQQYEEVAGFGTIRIYEATYKIGRLYENFAATWANQELPSMNENEKIVFVNNLNQTSAKLYDRAFVSYKTNYRVLQKLAHSYKQEEKDTSAAVSGRVVAEDSTLRIAGRWINLTGSKISEMLYRIAELNSSSIDGFLNAPLPAGLDEVSALEYRNQVLAKAVFPVVQKNIKAHLRNLNEADSLQLSNVWVEKSQQKLSDVMSILPARYKQLCLDAFATYKKKYADYTQIMTKGTDTEKENAIDLAGQLVNTIDLSKNYATLMIANYKVSIDNLIKSERGKTIARSLFADCVSATAGLGEGFRKAAEESREMKDYFTLLNQKEPKMVYEDAIYTYSDGETYLHDNALAISETTYQLNQNYNFPSIKFAQLATLLVKLDPAKYAKEFELEGNETQIPADPSWLMTVAVADSNWMLPDAGEENWQPAMVQTDSAGKEEPVILSAVTADTTSSDSTAASGLLDSTAIVQNVPEKFYLKREIDVDDIPLAATLSLNADDNVWVYVNGIKVFSEAKPDLGWGNVMETDLQPFLKQGKNILAIMVEDTDKSGHGIRPVLKLKTIGKNELVLREQKMLSTELSELGISDLDELIFNRYIVPQ